MDEIRTETVLWTFGGCSLRQSNRHLGADEFCSCGESPVWWAAPQHADHMVKSSFGPDIEF